MLQHITCSLCFFTSVLTFGETLLLSRPALDQVYSSCHVCLQEQQLCINGHNWGDVAIEGQTLKFRVGQQPAFRIPLQDVGQVQQSREEVRVGNPLRCSSLCYGSLYARPGICSIV